VGDIVKDILNTNGSHFDDFNLGNRKSQNGSTKKSAKKKKLEIELNIPNERDLLE
jgi:hypothetical protein